MSARTNARNRSASYGYAPRAAKRIATAGMSHFEALEAIIRRNLRGVYRADALFAVGMHPERPGNSLHREDFDRLWATVQGMLEIGVRYNRIINTDPKIVGKPRSRMRREERFLVYKRKACRTCRARIEAWPLAARTIYACPRCQSS